MTGFTPINHSDPSFQPGFTRSATQHPSKNNLIRSQKRPATGLVQSSNASKKIKKVCEPEKSQMSQKFDGTKKAKSTQVFVQSQFPPSLPRKMSRTKTSINVEKDKNAGFVPKTDTEQILSEKTRNKLAAFRYQAEPHDDGSRHCSLKGNRDQFQDVSDKENWTQIVMSETDCFVPKEIAESYTLAHAPGLDDHSYKSKMAKQPVGLETLRDLNAVLRVDDTDQSRNLETECFTKTVEPESVDETQADLFGLDEDFMEIAELEDAPLCMEGRCANVSSPLPSTHTVIPLLVEDPFPVFEEEFPLDEAEADELSKFSATKETHTQPSNLQIPFDDNSQTNEVYDAQLQHSPIGDGNEAMPTETLPNTSFYFPPSASPYTFSHSKTSSSVGPLEANSVPADEEDFFADDDEADLMTLAILSDVPDVAQHTSPSAGRKRPSTPKLLWNQPIYYNPTQSLPTPNSQMILPLAEQSASGKTAYSVLTSREVNQFPLQKTMQSPSSLMANVSPLSGDISFVPTPASSVPSHCIAFDTRGNALPFARPAFPNPIGDRCPIIGLSSSPVLRTCFRIGEAINAASSALRNDMECIIELYAQVTFSEREADGGRKQHFQFGDLFQKDKPPYLTGTYDMWKGIDLWDCDSSDFLGDNGKGKIARVVGKIKRGERSGPWKMAILSIWEADWEAVGFVKGIIFAQGKVEKNASDCRKASEIAVVS